MGPAGDRLAVAAAVLYSLLFYAAVILAQYFMLHAVDAHVSLFEVALERAFWSAPSRCCR